MPPPPLMAPMPPKVLPLPVPSITMTGLVICMVALALFELSATEVATIVTLPPEGIAGGAV